MSVRVEAGGESFEAELARGPVSKMIGMRFRREGKMVFRFRRSSRPFIDMFMVFTDLHMYFIREGKVVDSIHAERPGINPLEWRLYRPDAPADMLLESSEPLELEEGDEVNLVQ